MDEAERDEIVSQLTNALDTALAKFEAGITTKWLMLAETFDANGAKGLWFLSANDLQPWDTIGMLQYAITEQQAVVTRRALMETEDEEEE